MTPISLKFVVLALAVAVAGCAKSTGGALHAQSAKDRPIFVHLYMSGNECLVVAGEEPVPMGRGDRIVWEIRNDCTDRDIYLVRMENFKVKSTGTANNPGNNADPKRRVPRGESATLTSTIRPNADLTRYKYDIAIENGKRLDPELEVEY